MRRFEALKPVLLHSWQINCESSDVDKPENRGTSMKRTSTSKGNDATSIAL